MKYQEYAHIKLNLQDILCWLDEFYEDRAEAVLKSGADATAAEIHRALGEVAGIRAALRRLESQYGGEPINEMLHDTRY